MRRTNELETKKDHNSKNLRGVARVVHESFGIKLIAPVGFAGHYFFENTDLGSQLQSLSSKMRRTNELETKKDHNSKKPSGVARVLQESFGIKLIAQIVFAHQVHKKNTDLSSRSQQL